MFRAVLSAVLPLALLAAIPAPSFAQSNSAQGTAPAASSPLSIVLTGTLQQDGADLALILDTAQKRERVYSVNDCVPRRGANRRGSCGDDQGLLLRINADTIVVVMAGKQHVVKMGKGLTQAKPVTRPERPARPSRANRRSEAEADQAVDAEEAEDVDAQDDEEEEVDPPEEDEPESATSDGGQALGSN